MDNLEGVLQCLNEFGQTTDKSLSPELEQLLEHIAKTGRTVFPWPLLKPLISFKLEKVLNDFFESNSSANPYISEPTTKSQEFLPIVQKLISNVNCFSGTPFTIQRICELITEPQKHYKSHDKFLRGVEKNIMVVSTVKPDGSLITRSINSALTNGSVSPTESVLVDTTSTTVNNPSHSSPLNTSLEENAPSLSSPQTATIPADEKPAISSEENITNNSTLVNGSQSDKLHEEQPVVSEDLTCQENGTTQKNVASEEKLAAISDNELENIQKFSEETRSEEDASTVETEKIKDEIPDDEKEERMDES